jgi:hypothetical protein
MPVFTLPTVPTHTPTEWGRLTLTVAITDTSVDTFLDAAIFLEWNVLRQTYSCLEGITDEGEIALLNQALGTLAASHVAQNPKISQKFHTYLYEVKIAHVTRRNSVAEMTVEDIVSGLKDLAEAALSGIACVQATLATNTADAPSLGNGLAGHRRTINKTGVRPCRSADARASGC